MVFLSLSVLPIIKAASKAHRLYSRSCPNFAILFLQYYPVSYLWDHCNNLTTGSHNHCSLFPMFFQHIKKSGLFTASLYYFITSSSFSSYLKSNLLIRLHMLIWPRPWLPSFTPVTLIYLSFLDNTKHSLVSRLLDLMIVFFFLWQLRINCSLLREIVLCSLGGQMLPPKIFFPCSFWESNHLLLTIILCPHYPSSFQS